MPTKMAKSPNTKVAVIGAGVSGILATAYLKAVGVDVTVFERSSQSGGVVFDEHLPIEPNYPAIKPSKGEEVQLHSFPELEHAPPSPCYVGLKNNVATRLLRTKLSAWPAGTEDYVLHHEIKAYIQQISEQEGVDSSTLFGARVTNVKKAGKLWDLTYVTLIKDHNGEIVKEERRLLGFDSVVVASGHYHAPRVPDLPGLKIWKEKWPSRIWHSKRYRDPQQFRRKNILLIGAGTSSIDIARELGPIAKTIYQSSRNGLFDFPASMLPENGIRLGEISSFQAPEPEPNQTSRITDNQPIPSTVLLTDGTKICEIHTVIVCTGYHISLPFLQEYHQDDAQAEDANGEVLVTDGTQMHNLHKDIFYIPDPSLIFIGVPYFTATFTLFEYQAIAIAAVVSGRANLPSETSMRKEYEAKLQRKGAGKQFHSLRGVEVDYVQDLLQWINSDAARRGLDIIVEGHSKEWHDAKKEQMARMENIFGNGADDIKGSLQVRISNCT